MRAHLEKEETKSKRLRDRQHHPRTLSLLLGCAAVGARREGGLCYLKVLCVEHKAGGSGK